VYIYRYVNWGFICIEISRVASVKRDPLIKISIVSSARDIEAVVWRRRDIVMSDQDVDDVAFLTGRLKRNPTNKFHT